MSIAFQTSPATRPIAERVGVPPFPVCWFTVDEYHRMIEAGILSEDDQVELLKGWIVPLMPQNTPHKQAIPLGTLAFTSVLPPEWYPAVQQPVGVADSEPQPDFSIVRGSPRDYPDGTPKQPDVGLLVEVSDTSLNEDRTIKGPLYAEAGFAIYWIVNLVDRIVEVYTQPSEFGYQSRQDFFPHEAVPLVLDGHVVARIPVRDLLP